jgi:hypothetical protein
LFLEQEFQSIIIIPLGDELRATIIKFIEEAVAKAWYHDSNKNQRGAISNIILDKFDTGQLKDFVERLKRSNTKTINQFLANHTPLNHQDEEINKIAKLQKSKETPGKRLKTQERYKIFFEVYYGNNPN